MQSKNERFQEMPFGEPEKSGRSTLLVILCWALVLAGTAAFLAGALGFFAQRAWRIYLINYLFWTGIAFGSMFFIALMNVIHARWMRPFKRFAEAQGSFVVISFFLFWVLFWGKEEIFPWIRNPVPEKEPWLDVAFLFLRDGIGLFLLAAAAMVMIYFSLKSDLELTSGRLSGEVPDSAKLQRRWRAQTVLSPIFLVLYGFVLTVISWDLIMSLDPEWVSTLFGMYFFTGCLYSGLAALVVLSMALHRFPGVQPYLKPPHFHDLGKLLLGSVMVFGDFFFSQYLLIWYGNKPDETKFLILRTNFEPWSVVSLVMVILTMAMPFFVLLNRRVKMMPGPMMILGVAILAGMWLERYILVAPSLWRTQEVPFGLPEILVSVGFLGAFALCVLTVLRRFPVFPVSDPLLPEGLRHEKLNP